jgi:hypothetical protein
MGLLRSDYSAARAGSYWRKENGVVTKPKTKKIILVEEEK